ncbi:hypothetical protein [Streptosporangium sp. NPDC049644]|uniref:hypothetical protein n=1 Tax=Streptosporangium sp. NPDC049644 TaxID=3155507 RepID=UPI00342CA7A9
MGYELRRWLADRLPAGLSSGERLVALEIADQANDQSRHAYGSETRAVILRRTGYADEKQLGKVLTKLAKNGIEMREPVRGKDGEPVRDKRGRVVYACNGHEMSEFVVPRLEDLPSCPERGSFLYEAAPERSPDRVSKRDEGAPHGPEGPPSGAASDAKVPRLVPKVPPAGHPSPQSPQENSSSLLSHERVVMEALAPAGATEDEMREVITEIRQATKGRIENPNGYFRAIAERGDLPDYLSRVRANAERRAAYAARQAQPPPAVPEQAPDPDEPPVTPEEAADARAAVREALRGSQARRSEKGPARVLRPRHTPEEVSPALQAARDYLNTRGDYFEWMATARDKLGPDAARDEVVVLAAELAKERTP